MRSKICPVCGVSMIKNGFTTARKQRWRCSGCGLSSIHTNDVSARDLKAFLAWLFSKDTQYCMPGQGRTFRRRIEPIWKIWPIAPVVDEIHKVIYVDGIYLARDVVILIARSDEYVLSWHLARSESAHSYRELLKRMAPPPLMAVSDGGCGFLKAVRDIWPQTFIQRCLLRMFC